MTEALAVLEGLERGPAGNTSLAAAFSLAQEMDKDQILVVQETEYTGAGKHPNAQLTFARNNGIEIKRGNPADNIPGRRIVIPQQPGQIKVKDVDLSQARRSYLKNAAALAPEGKISQADCEFLAQDCGANLDWVKQELAALGISTGGTRHGQS